MRFFDRVMSQRGGELFAVIRFFFTGAASRLSGPERLPHRSNKRARFFATRGDVGDL
jgi:hypothetical protein